MSLLTILIDIMSLQKVDICYHDFNIVIHYRSKQPI